jgi:hypothetical protein
MTSTVVSRATSRATMTSRGMGRATMTSRGTSRATSTLRAARGRAARAQLGSRVRRVSEMGGAGV